MNNIYVSKDGQQHGPFSLEEVRQQVQSVYFSPVDSAWCEGMPDWVPIGDILPRQTQTPPKSATSTQPAARASVSSSKKTPSKKRRAQKHPVKNNKQTNKAKDPIWERVWNDFFAPVLGGLCWLIYKSPYIIILTLIVLAVIGIMTSHPPSDQEQREQKREEKRKYQKERDEKYERELFKAAKEYDLNH